MREPAPYPETDAVEQDAVTTFLSLIDTRFVKADIRTRDKYPNVDGTVEIVDQKHVPIGKLEAQIRKIPDGATKYSCSAKLVGYSEVSTLPVILVCVDTFNKMAYWKSVSPVMPEYKEGQKSFTVNFDSASDTVEASGIYIQKWTDLVLDYRQRIAQHPVLRKEIASKLTLPDIPAEDKRYFQTFIDTINTLFDQDFIAVKGLLFSDVWKLGVGIYAIDQHSASYQIYKIPYGEPAPLVCSLEGNPFDFEQSSPCAFSSHYSTRQHLGDAEKAGKSYVLDYVKKVVQNRRLSIHGVLLSTDILFAFLDQYAHCINLNSGQESYSVSEINFGLSDYLPGVCASIAANLGSSINSTHILLDFDMVSNMVRQGNIHPLPQRERSIRFFLYSPLLSLKAVDEAVRYLTANDIDSICRPFAKRSLALTPGNSWVWSGYTEEDESANVLRILASSIDEYSAFVSGNRLKFPESVFLDQTTAIVYVYDRSSKPQSQEWPILQEYYLENPNSQLPKVTVAFGYDPKPRVEAEDSLNVKIDGKEFSAKSCSKGVASFLFHRTPVLNMIYRMLCRDLKEHYQIGHIPGGFEY